MNRERLNWGLVLLFIGVMWLLSNFGVINFYWSSLWRFWPVFLIIIGVNLLVPKEGMGNFISIVVTVIALVFVGYQVSRPSKGWLSQLNWQGREDWDEADDSASDISSAADEIKVADFTSPYNAQVKVAHLEIHGGAVEYKIEGETDDLFRANTKSTFGGHLLETSQNDSTEHLNFRMKKFNKKNWRMNNEENSAVIALNTKPLWYINIEMGAGAAAFDLTPYRVKQLEMKGGAASFEAKLGMPVQESGISAESGMASIEIKIPKEAACRITVESGLSSKSFDGFTKQSDDSYVTSNYASATDKFNIHLKGGLSSFSVSRY